MRNILDRAYHIVISDLTQIRFYNCCSAHCLNLVFTHQLDQGNPDQSDMCGMSAAH